MDNIGAGYIMLEKDVAGFIEIGELPPELYVRNVTNWDAVVYCAKWHRLFQMCQMTDRIAARDI